MTLYRLNSSPVGIYISIHLFFHTSDISYLNSAVNGPKYDINEADNNIFPTKFFKSSYNYDTFIFHLTDSLPKPLNNFSALANYISAVFCFYFKLSASLVEFSNLILRFATVSYVFFNIFIFSFSFVSTYFNYTNASFNAISLGPTSFLTF
jgi:hypothetical protein